MMAFLTTIFLIFLCPFFVFAQDVPVLNQIDSLIPTSFSPMIIMAVAFVLELVMRAWPTAKPKSFLIMISSALKSLSNITLKLSDLADKLVQNIKPDPEQPK
jgi:hypothetical protein